MTEAQANKIKIKVEVFNELYAPITLRFQMFSTSENNWAVTITYNYTENEWMTFASLDSSYNQINDKLSGFQFGIEAVEAYQEENGNLKFSHSDLPLGQDKKLKQNETRPPSLVVFSWRVFLLSGNGS